MKREKLSKAAASGAVALIFLVLGFQAAIFTGNVFRYNSGHSVDTVYVVDRGEYAGHGTPPGVQVSDSQVYGKSASPALKGKHIAENADNQDDALQRAPAVGPGLARRARRSGSTGQSIETEERRPLISRGIAPRQDPDWGDARRAVAGKLEHKPAPELFPFDPNTVTVEELVRLGFSQRQAQVIENYRSKGGKFTTANDFARMYVVDSAAYVRLEPFIKIKKLNLNTADSLQLLSLRGIGPYYAHKILEYRRRLGGMFTSADQLLEIEGFEKERLLGFAQSIEVTGGKPRFSIWSATRSELAAHPYIGSYAAKGIARYKSLTDTAVWSLQDLADKGILSKEDAARLNYLGRRETDDE